MSLTRSPNGRQMRRLLFICSQIIKDNPQVKRQGLASPLLSEKSHLGLLLVPKRCNHSQATKKKGLTVSFCYNLLEVESDCSDEELRLAYLDKVKNYHPDRNEASNSASKFTLIQEAYKNVLEHRRGQEVLAEIEEKANQVDIHDIRHTVPQHRRYLSYDGVGYGSPSMRQRQFTQFKVAKATESVYEHRKMKFGAGESSVVAKDKAEARKIKISNLIDRTVDDLIRDAMQRGDFDNLSGQGKPLDYSNHNPLVDPITHNLNKILVNNGFKPEWIMLSKEIRDGICQARERLATGREQMGAPPYTEEEELVWNSHLKQFKERVAHINTQINRFNFMVPFMEKQMVHYDWQKNYEKVLADHKQYLPRDENGNFVDVPQFVYAPSKQDDRIQWKDVWPTIKSFFK